MTQFARSASRRPTRVVLLGEQVTHAADDLLAVGEDPDSAAYATRDWCRFNGSETTFIDPGSPWQNGHIEPFDSRLRDEFLNGQFFESLHEA